MYRSFLSWRYMRRRRTNLIGIVGIFIAVGALILILSIMTGFLEESRKTVRGSLADLIVQPARQSDVASPDELLAHLRARAEVLGATAQLHWPGMVTHGGRATAYLEEQLAQPNLADLSFVQVIGVDLEGERNTTEFLRSLEQVKGERDRVADLAAPFAPPPGYRPTGRPLASAILGEQLLDALQLVRGQIVRITIPVPDGEGGYTQSDREYVVAGASRSGENDFDLGTLFLEREEMIDFMGWSAQYSQILVKLRDYEHDGERLATEWQKSLGQSEFGPHIVRTWEQSKQNLIKAIENERTLMAIMLSLVLVVAGFTVFAILSMMVTEKRRDIGILCALGATSRGILCLFLLIGFWDALLGATLGAVVGVFAAFRIDPIERWLSEAFGVQIFNRDIYIFDHIPSVVSPIGVALIVLGAFVFTLLFAALPAIQAARMHPLDALRYE